MDSGNCAGSNEFILLDVDQRWNLQGYAKTGQTSAAMQEVKWGSDYLLSCINQNGSDATLVYQVGPPSPKHRDHMECTPLIALG